MTTNTPPALSPYRLEFVDFGTPLNQWVPMAFPEDGTTLAAVEEVARSMVDRGKVRRARVLVHGETTVEYGWQHYSSDGSVAR